MVHQLQCNSVCVCLAITSPLCTTGHSGVHWYSLSTRCSAQVEMCPFEMNSLTLKHRLCASQCTQISELALPVSLAEGDDCPMSAFNIAILCLTSIMSKTLQSLYVPLLSPNFWYSDICWACHTLSATVFTKQGPASGGISVLCRAGTGCDGVWWVMGLLCWQLLPFRTFSWAGWCSSPHGHLQGKPGWLVLSASLLARQRPFWHFFFIKS